MLIVAFCRTDRAIKTLILLDTRADLPRHWYAVLATHVMTCSQLKLHSEVQQCSEVRTVKRFLQTVAGRFKSRGAKVLTCRGFYRPPL